MTFPAVQSQTPTQFDLARWLYEQIASTDGAPKTRAECIELMSEIIAVIRPPLKGKQDSMS
jgi:hypothetical protein